MNGEAELIISLTATGTDFEGTVETKISFHSVGQQGPFRLGRAISFARMGTICESQKADVMAEGELQGCRGLPGNGGSASLLQSSRKSSVCLASKAGQGVQQRKGLYLPMAVVQVHQDIQSLKHSTHGVDGDQRPVSLPGPITQPAQVAAGYRRGTFSRGVEWGGDPRGLVHIPPHPSPASLRQPFPPAGIAPSHLTSVVRKGRNWTLSTLRVIRMCLRSEL